MAPSKTELLHESGYGTSSTYGDYNTYQDQGFSKQQDQAVNPFATNAGYAFSPSPRTPNPAIEKSQWVLLGSALCFVGAIILGFTQNAQIAARIGNLSSGAAIAAGVCQVITALFLYGLVAYLMNRRENNGRMIGIAFSLIGIVMGIIWAVLGFFSGNILGVIAAVLCLGVVLFNCIWLYQTNQPKLHRGLRK